MCTLSPVRSCEGWGTMLCSRLSWAWRRRRDAELLRLAHDQSRIFVTRDRDFGVLVFVQGRGPGVIYLRVIAATLRAVHDELARALSLYTEQELRAAFIVIEPGRHRIRRPRSSA